MNKKMDPKISVVMPNYNDAKFLSQAIESILTQTFSDFEFIIIDDGSTDNSWEIIQGYAKKDNRIVALQNEKNLRICKTLNKGIQIAKGEYIARMDSDDVCLPERFEKQIQFMEKDENHKIGVCGTNFFIINAGSKRIGVKDFPESHDECKKTFWFRNPFGHNTVLIRKECFDELGNYDDNFIYAEDLELWMRFGQRYELHNMQEYLVEFRSFGENTFITRQKKMIDSTLKARKKAFTEYGYYPGLRGYIAYMATWVMRFVPPTLVLKLFNAFNSSKNRYPSY
jgi:glycosyltransferase involved in cell wall biosynthesis